MQRQHDRGERRRRHRGELAKRADIVGRRALAPGGGAPRGRSPAGRTARRRACRTRLRRCGGTARSGRIPAPARGRGTISAQVTESTRVLTRAAGFDAADQPVQPAPPPLQLLQPARVQNGIELGGQQPVDAGNVAIERGPQPIAARRRSKPARSAPNQAVSADGRSRCTVQELRAVGRPLPRCLAPEEPACQHARAGRRGRGGRGRELLVRRSGFGATQRPLAGAAARMAAGCARPCACWSSAPPSAATAADRRRHCRSRACRGFPSPRPAPRAAGSGPSCPGRPFRWC